MFPRAQFVTSDGDAGVDGPNPAPSRQRGRPARGPSPSGSLVPPGGFENSTRGQMVTRASTARIRPLAAKGTARTRTVPLRFTGAPGRIRKLHPRIDGDAGVDGPNPAPSRQRGRPARGPSPSGSLVPPGGFEPSTPALGGRVYPSHLRFSDFTWFYITARETACFLFSVLVIRYIVHPYFTPYALAGVKSLR